MHACTCTTFVRIEFLLAPHPPQLSTQRHLAALGLVSEVLHELHAAAAHGKHGAELVEELLGRFCQLLVLVVRQLVQQLKHSTDTSS